MVDGTQHVVLIDKAPVKTYGNPDDLQEVALSTLRYMRLVSAERKGHSFTSRTRAGGNRSPRDPARGRPRASGQCWWVQDAETGVPLPYAVRESEMVDL